MLEVKYLEELQKMATVNRRISTGEKEIPHLIKDILTDIDYFNSFDEFHHSLEDNAHTLFENVPILNEFKDFITPRSVRLEPGNLRTTDLLVRPKAPEKMYEWRGKYNKGSQKIEPEEFEYEFNLAKYMINIADFRHYYKKDANSDTTSLENLKRHVSLTEALDSIYILSEGVKYVKSGIESCIPYKIVNLSALFEDGYFDSSYDVSVINYMHKIIW